MQQMRGAADPSGRIMMPNNMQNQYRMMQAGAMPNGMNAGDLKRAAMNNRNP